MISKSLDASMSTNRELVFDTFADRRGIGKIRVREVLWYTDPNGKWTMPWSGLRAVKERRSCDGGVTAVEGAGARDRFPTLTVLRWVVKMQRETRSQKKEKTRVKASQTSLDVFSLLKTNHVTAPHERPLIEASIERYRRGIESAEEEIRRLSNKQATYELIIEAHYNLLHPSPMRTLPPEILSDIFAAYCDMHQLPDRPGPSHVSCSSRTFLQSRMHLLRICRRWREVALSTPRLWNTFPIIRKSAELDQRWLASAGKLPVELSYHVNDHKRAQQLLCAYLPRCETLHLHIPSDSGVDTLYRIPRASRLTTLTLQFPSDARHHSEIQPWTESLLQNVPELISLTTNFPPEVLSPLATQLSHLSLLDYITPLEVLPYLRVLKRLKSIHFTLYSRDIVPPEPEPITHEHLQSLHFKYARPFIDDQHEILLDHLILPRLRHLDIKPSTFYPESLIKLFERSSCQISTLALDVRCPHPRHENYKLAKAGITDGLGECLKSPQVGKHLKKFFFIMRESSEDRKKIPDALLQLLSANGNHLPKLTELCVPSSPSQTPQILELLRNRATDYRENGVAQLELLEIQYKDSDVGYGEPHLSDRDIATLRKTGTVVETRIRTGKS
ncbi:hypothetical protein BDZ89DRAFT_1203221 [Hymenopellis radicata]|nr:hypothetical protein BDZ89DRAFT_1203221 [Hymenopellis radicata]